MDSKLKARAGKIKGVSLDVVGNSLDFAIEGKAQQANHTWYRGEACNYNPKEENMVSEEAVVRHVLDGWANSPGSVRIL